MGMDLESTAQVHIKHESRRASPHRWVSLRRATMEDRFLLRANRASSCRGPARLSH